MKKSVQTLCVAVRDNRLPNGHMQARHAKRAKTYRNLPKTAPTSALIVQSKQNLRISPAAQLQIIKLYLEGHSLSEISRETNRARQTVTKICRAPDVQAKIRELREKLLGESDDWLESINFAVTHELNGLLAYTLLKDFGVIPQRVENSAAERQSNQEPLDGEPPLEQKGRSTRVKRSYRSIRRIVPR